MDAFTSILHETLGVTALISLPVLCVATLVGTSLALLQAVTQIQEQTLTVLPKFFLVGCCVVMGSRFAMQALADLLRHGVALMPSIVNTP